MAKCETPKLIIDIKSIFIAIIIGLIIYFSGCAMVAYLIKKEILSYELLYIYPKIILLLTAMMSCSYASKGRGEAKINILCCAIILFAFSVAISIAFPEKEMDVLGAIISLFICILSCVFISLSKNKNSKLHKRNKNPHAHIQGVIKRRS